MAVTDYAYRTLTPQEIEAVGRIFREKGLYNEQKQAGGDYEQHAEAAKPYYQILVDSGLGDLADTLGKSTYKETASIYDLLNKTSNTPTARAGLIDQLISDGSGANINMDNLPTQTNEYLNVINKYLQPNEQEQSILNQSTANLMKQLDIFTDNNALTQSQSQNLLNQLSQFATDQSGRYDSHYNWLKDYNPYNSDMGRALMGYFDQHGNTAAGNAIASGAADNAGNIDSYAAANANRQQLAFKNAGANAITNQYNAQTTQMLNTLQSLGVDVNAALESAGNVISNNQNYNLGILGNYTTGDINLQNVAGSTQMARNQAITDILGKYLGTQETNVGAASTDYQNKLNAALDAYNIATEADMQGQVLQQSKEQAELEQAAEMEKIAAEMQQHMDNIAYKYYDTDTTAQTKQYETDVDSQTRKDVASTQAGATMYGHDRTYEGKLAENQTKENLAQMEGERAIVNKMIELDSGAMTTSNYPYSVLKNEMLAIMDETGMSADTAALEMSNNRLYSAYPNFIAYIKQIAKDVTAELKAQKQSATTDTENPFATSGN